MNISMRGHHLLFATVFLCFLSFSNRKTIGSFSDTGRKEKSITYTYDLAHPKRKWILPDELLEISGQSWVDKNHLLAIEDLHAVLYLLRLDSNIVVEKKKIFKERSGKEDKKFDIEDVAIVNDKVYALWSHGVIYKIKNWETDLKTKKLETSLSKENNTEGMCFDPVSKNLLIACKKESGTEDEKKSTRAIFEFDLSADTLITKPFLIINKKDFLKVTDEKLKFFPSAIAVHPITHDLYILSTKDNKCMAQFSYQGELKSLQFIDRNLMVQPEGICFSPDGTLYISSEGKNGVPAVICEYGYSK